MTTKQAMLTLVDHTTIDVNLDNAADVTRLYLETQGIQSPMFRVIASKVNDLFGEIDVTIRSLSPIPDGFEPTATFFIPVSFWLWAESQIEFESEVFAVA